MRAAALPGVVDRWALNAWFDADHPDSIVDPQLIRAHAAIDRSIHSGREA